MVQAPGSGVLVGVGGTGVLLGVGGMGVALGWMVGEMGGTAVSVAVAKEGGGINVAVGSMTASSWVQEVDRARIVKRIIKNSFFIRVL